MSNELRARQVELEHLFNKNQLIPRIRKEFTDCTVGNFMVYIHECGIPVLFGIDLLVQMVLHKRTSLDTLIGCLRHHLEGEANNVQSAGQLAANYIYKAAEADLVDYDPELRVFIMKYDISPDVQAELDCFQFPLPMIIPPREVRTNKDNGYLESSGSIILRHNHHNDDVCLDHINRMNAVRYVINHDTAAMVQNKWRSLDKPKAGETRKDFERRKRAFEKYDRTAREVIGMLTDEFYLTHKYDKRGRVYCQGYHVTYQGAPWNKAVIELADKEIIE